MQSDFFAKGRPRHFNQFEQMDKASLRAWLRTNIGSGFSQSADMQEQQVSFEQQLKKFLMARKGVWGAFRATAYEPQLAAVIAECSHLTWVYPKLENEVVRFYSSPQLIFEKNSRGIEEPPAVEKFFCELSNIDGLLIPGLAFTAKGGRLGRGRGHYDRVLANFGGLKIGVCFNDFVLESLPLEGHDVRMDGLVTPLGIVSCRENFNN